MRLVKETEKYCVKSEVVHDKVEQYNGMLKNVSYQWYWVEERDTGKIVYESGEYYGCEQYLKIRKEL